MLPISPAEPAYFYPLVRQAENAAEFGARVEAAANEMSAEDAAAYIRAAVDQARDRAQAQPGPCYRLRVPSAFALMKCQSEVFARLGGPPPAPETIRGALIAGVATALPADCRDAALAAIEACYEAEDARRLAGIELPANYDALREARDAASEAVADRVPSYLALITRQTNAVLVGMAVRLRYFVEAADGSPGAPSLPRGADGMLADVAITRLVQLGHAALLDAEIQRLASPDDDAVGNSGSPVPVSPPGRATSRAARKPRTGRRGKSAAGSTGKIRA